MLCLFHRFLTQYKGVYERDVKCQVKMSHNSGNVGQGPPSPSKDEVSDALLQVCGMPLILGCYCRTLLYIKPVSYHPAAAVVTMDKITFVLYCGLICHMSAG